MPDTETTWISTPDGRMSPVIIPGGSIMCLEIDDKGFERITWWGNDYPAQVGP